MARYGPESEGGRYDDGLELSIDQFVSPAQQFRATQGGSPSGVDIVEVVTLPAIAATANNLSLGDGTYFRLSTSGGAQIITGFANVQAGRRVFLFNVGANNITLNNLDAGSSTENQIITGTGAAVVIAPNGAVILVYDNISTKWRKAHTV